MADPTYQELDPRVSQGDIFEIAPHLYLEAPLSAIVEAETPGLYRIATEPHAAFDTAGLKVAAPCSRKLAIVVTADCEIDKRARWIVCPIVPLDEIPGQVRGHAKRNRVFKFFFLPRYRELMADGVVVLDQITTVNKNLLEGVNRITSLSDDGRFGLYTQFIRLMTRWEFKDVQCPVCGSHFDPTLGMTVRSAD